MSHIQCPYCSGLEGRCTPSGSGRFITECKACARVVDERRVQIHEVFVERATDTPLCIVTPDFSDNERFRVPPLDDDPFESSGFITAFSTWSLEATPLFTNTTSTVCGHLAELERVMAEYYPNGGANLAGSLNLVDMLRAYFQIVEVSSVLGLERDSSEHAIQLFRDCSTATLLRNRNIEALATAALVQASREAQEPRTLQEISVAANIPQKEIARHMKLLSDALKLSQPINSNSISVHMPRFCNLLQLNKTTQDLASHIGEVVISKSFCTRRNPISISAAAIYLACQLEDKRKTQTEICKATGLTEVTLRKVYKELLENLDDLMPKDYTPAVPPEKAFPVTTGLRVSTISKPSVESQGSGVGIDSSSGATVLAGGGFASMQSSGASFRMPSTAAAAAAQIPPHLRSLSAASSLAPVYARPPGNVFMMPPTMSSSVTPLAFLGGEASREAEKPKTGLRTDKFDVDLNAGYVSPSTSPREAENPPQSSFSYGTAAATPPPFSATTTTKPERRPSLHDLNMVPTMDDDEIVELDMFERKPPGPDLNGAPQAAGDHHQDSSGKLGAMPFMWGGPHGFPAAAPKKQEAVAAAPWLFNALEKSSQEVKSEEKIAKRDEKQTL
ncbi:plant-specific TFIIB-related protein 1 [Selaginella moellendorffii]|nr:plant-specific TFIIB-related protein 1 [Selaginella moellendorffii]|eukprot:XP_024529281.1 plant-specific TFIIB-related protein 1 [Selaginella moellendorffii]